MGKGYRVNPMARNSPRTRHNVHKNRNRHSIPKQTLRKQGGRAKRPPFQRGLGAYDLRKRPLYATIN
ncbi:hypothetical protein AA0119_g13502 [Alternaria tenuissima]|uniref:Uncharacterized protein n=2 Tax=Alternaria alternata complex TaxID=187734 RepID=A0A4Q4MVG4_ALTAL|nr:hypothetical protein AA0115_g12595 [Alternaria tenuissima]RYN28576.1 hypothetical protein AA0114_g12431 [Alternaria tenuissima]RYN61337.1 hypothetical protein AA0117_g12988 [Alternaria alternata]RYN80019.1 hypothetical protein AA0119_g13502 [Alternaria tenuissima]RYN97666.1 hypothetical protein AA0121_g13515 [Alternaria tenuissima]